MRKWLAQRVQLVGGRKVVAKRLGISVAALDKWISGENRIAMLSDIKSDREKLAVALEWSDAELCVAAGFPLRSIDELDEDTAKIILSLSTLSPIQRKMLREIMEKMIEAFHPPILTSKELEK